MINAGVIGYAVCATAFSVLTFLLAVGSRNGWQGRSVLLASFITFVWAVFASFQASSEYLDNLYLSLFELLREGSWLLFLVVLLANANFTGQAKRLLMAASKIILLILICLCLYMFLSGLGVFALTSLLDFTGLTLIRLIVVVIGLIFIEQLFRNSRPESRWAVKFLFFGIGGIFCYDFYLYADALLFNRVDVDIWKARGYVNALAVPFITVSIIRNKDWSVDLFVSRELVFHSVAVTGIGIYLLLMAAGGYYIRIYDGDWGGVAQIAFFFGAGLVLFILMFSGQMRAYLRVFIVKNFRHYKYDYREEWLRVIRLLSTKQVKKELQENAIRVLSDIVESPRAGLWVRDEVGEYRAAAIWNMDAFEMCSEKDNSSMIKFLHQWQWVIDLDEYVEAPDLYQGLKLPNWIEGEKKFWLIVPLMLQTKLYGFVVLGQARVPMKIGWEERDLLLTTGRQITSYFALMDMDESLAEARQFDAYNRLSAYVVHDLKNLVAQLSLVVSNAGKHKGNPVFMEDAIDTVENAVNKMSKLLSQLRKGTVVKSNLQNVHLDELLQKVVSHRDHDSPQPLLTLSHTGITLLVDRDRFGAVLEHLVQNAQEATLDAGKVEIRLSSTKQKAVIEIIDNGCGMDKQFIRERLFKPFDTTKGNAGMGIGVYESREFIHSLGGSLNVDSEPGQGTKFTISLLLGN